MLAANSEGSPSPTPSPGTDDRSLRLKKQLHQHLIASMDLSTLGTLSDEQLRSEVQRATEELCRRSPDLLSFSEREQLVKELLDETFGLGPLEVLMHDPNVTDILINGPHTVYVERRGVLELTKVRFNDDRHLMQIIQRIVGRVGRRVDETTPMVDARLADGSRFNAIIPPAALDGPLVSIRRFGTRPFTVDDLLAHQSITPEMVEFICSCVRARVNMIFSGGTGSGKTTLLNAMSASIPANERVATIEDAAELRLQQPHVVRLEARPPNIEGVGEITIRELVRNTLRMRPDRIIVGEVRGGEALDMLQAMNTGHEGSMTTIHANDTRDALSRLEMMVGMAGVEIPIWIIRRQIASSIHLIVQGARLLGGPRKIIRISEVTGMEGEIISLQDIFAFKQTGVDEAGVAQGYFHATGLRPHCLERLVAAGVHLPPELFEQRILTPEVRGQKSEVRGQKSEVRRPSR